jgi:hypothetical protein
MDQKLNWNVTQALEKPFTIDILSYMDSRCLVTFSSNVSWDPTQSVSLFWLREWEQCSVSVTIWQFFAVWVFRAGYTARIFLYEVYLHKHISCNSNPKQNERGFTLEWRSKYWTKFNQLVSSEGNESVAWHKNKLTRFLRLQVPRKLLFMRCMNTYFGKVVGAWIWPQTIIYVEITSGAIILNLYISVLSI